MKRCPFRQNQVSRDPIGDCMRHSCAWWVGDEEIGDCAPVASAKVLQGAPEQVKEFLKFHIGGMKLAVARASRE